ncbi:MAG: hypothetical protein LBQ54_13845 [Planctomycetaceae bacterium]|nr:hypothetical protein [Planctomycetaceae bacterium]
MPPSTFGAVGLNAPLALLAGIRERNKKECSWKRLSIGSRMERSDDEASAIQRATLAPAAASRPGNGLQKKIHH